MARVWWLLSRSNAGSSSSSTSRPSQCLALRLTQRRDVERCHLLRRTHTPTWLVMVCMHSCAHTALFCRMHQGNPAPQIPCCQVSPETYHVGMGDARRKQELPPSTDAVAAAAAHTVSAAVVLDDLHCNRSGLPAPCVGAAAQTASQRVCLRPATACVATRAHSLTVTLAGQGGCTCRPLPGDRRLLSAVSQVGGI